MEVRQMAEEIVEIDLDLKPEQKAAAVVVSMGVEHASEIYKFLTEEEIENLTVEVAKLGHLTSEQTLAVLDEFYKVCLTQKVVTDGGIEYARTVLEKAFGESTAARLLEKLNKFMKASPFDFIRKTDSKNILSVLQHERPQTIALVLSYAGADQTAQVIEELPKEKRIQVVKSIASMDRASPEAIKVVEAELKKRFSNILTTDYTQIGGIDYIAEVMNSIDRSNEKYIFEELGKEDAQLAEDIRKKMFVFEDILLLDDRSIQRVLRDVDNNDLAVSLKSSNEEVKAAIFNNLSKRLASMIQEDMEFMGPVRMKDVEEAQQKIVNVIRKLEDSAEIVISRGGGDEIVV